MFPDSEKAQRFDLSAGKLISFSMAGYLTLELE